MKRFITAILLFATTGIMAQKIEFKADITDIQPMSYPGRSRLTDFSLELRNDSAFIHMPYVGEVYTPVMNSDGLNFDAPYTGLTIKPTKKKDGQIVKFNVKHNFLTYNFNITLWDSNRIDIFVQPSNAQSCNYMGEWTKPETKK